MTITYDGSFDIAAGRSRKETSWKNKEMLWSDLVAKLSTTHYTAETHAEYLAAKKPRQDEIKDIGGFVGGFLTGGRRKAASVLHRQLITLDLDFAKAGMWDDLQLTYDNAAVVYSTHKHSADAPRLRLIMPLDRPVRPDEYEAIARRIAGILDIELFDPTTFQPERLMYWPSTSKGAEYIFEMQDGPWIEADKILSTYHDWTDSSEWPVSDRVDKILKRNMLKQGDPLEKPGVVGAFCRTYSIEEAIETYLPDVYDACEIESRYTYKEGSTAAGLIVYEDKYAYSHHGTDPVSGKLCNAFDLVRIHKFGLKDEDAREGTPGNKLPSYAAMIDFATKDKKVRTLLVSEKLEEAKGDFEEILAEEPEEDTEWFGELKVDKRGDALSTIGNVAIILENDPLLKGRFATDEFLRKKVILKNLPWRKVTHDTRFIKDEDEQNLVKYLEKAYGISNRANIKDAFDTHIDANSFHPIRDYLNSLDALFWDGKERVDTLFIDYMGAADTEYIRAVTRKALCACVARIFKPGVKFDYILTLIGEEGLYKSTLISKLAGEWFSDSFNFNMLRSKEAYEQIQGVWMIEIGELTGLRTTEIEAAKQFISKQEDDFRPSYGRNKITCKRQCVFFASTNNYDFLRGSTGNRRFWPVTIHEQPPAKDVFKDLTRYEIDQIWAEVLEFYSKKEPLYLPKEIETTARRVQKEHSEIDSRVGLVQRYLDMLFPENWDEMSLYEKRAYLNNEDLQAEATNPKNRVCAAEIWCEALGGNERDINRTNTKEVHNLMRQISGWKPHNSTIRFKAYGTQRGYIREEFSMQTEFVNEANFSNS